MQGRPEPFDDAVDAAETVRTRYAALWEELHLEPELSPDDRHAVRARIRRLNDLGLRGRRDRTSSPPRPGRTRPAAGRRDQPPLPRPRARAADRARRPRGPGAPAAQRPARVPGLARVDGRRPVDEAEAARALAATTSSSRASTRSCPAIGPAARPAPGLLRRARGEVDPVRAGRPRRRAARPRSTPISASGRRRPRRTGGRTAIALDIDWSGGLDPPTASPTERAVALDPGTMRADGSRSPRRHGQVADAGHDPVVRVRGLTKRYGDVQAVDGIDFEVAPRRGLRPARAERRRQDDDGRDPRGPARARRRRGDRARRGRRTATPTRSSRGSASASRRRRSTRS